MTEVALEDCNFRYLVSLLMGIKIPALHGADNRSKVYFSVGQYLTEGCVNLPESGKVTCGVQVGWGAFFVFSWE